MVTYWNCDVEQRHSFGTAHGATPRLKASLAERLQQRASVVLEGRSFSQPERVLGYERLPAGGQ